MARVTAPTNRLSMTNADTKVKRIQNSTETAGLGAWRPPSIALRGVGVGEGDVSEVHAEHN